MRTPQRPDTALVYSTDAGRICPGCRQPISRCACAAMKAKPVGDGIARISRETKGRGGKAVTVVRGLALDVTALAELGKALRTACGSGGTVKDGSIEVQGDHADRIAGLLAARGYTVRGVGGSR